MHKKLKYIARQKTLISIGCIKNKKRENKNEKSKNKREMKQINQKTFPLQYGIETYNLQKYERVSNIKI